MGSLPGTTTQPRYSCPVTRSSIPVIVLAGFLGSGKTTVLNHLMRHSASTRIGVIVNDFGKINIDAMLVGGQADSTITTSGGCLCCVTDDGEIADMLDRLAAPARNIDVIVIEASGVAEPGAMVRLVTQALDARMTYGGLIEVVDAREFPTVRRQHDELDRHVEIADLVLINKADAVSIEELDHVRAMVTELNPIAPVISTVNGTIDPQLLYDPRSRPNHQPTLAMAAPSEHDHDHDGANDDHLHQRFQHLDFDTAHALHPRRLVTLLEGDLAGVFRIKGIVRFAGPGHRTSYAVGKVGPALRLDPIRETRAASELVLIGSELHAESLSERLSACVATDAEAAELTDDDLMGVLRLTRIG